MRIMQKLKINIRKGSKKIFVLLIFILLFISIFFILSSNNTNLLAISIDEDSDNDGWNDTIERSYNTDINNSSDFPKDTDSDGIKDGYEITIFNTNIIACTNIKITFNI